LRPCEDDYNEGAFGRETSAIFLGAMLRKAGKHHGETIDNVMITITYERAT
jgi:hypothetical protein